MPTNNKSATAERWFEAVAWFPSLFHFGPHSPPDKRVFIYKSPTLLEGNVRVAVFCLPPGPEVAPWGDPSRVGLFFFQSNRCGSYSVGFFGLHVDDGGWFGGRSIILQCFVFFEPPLNRTLPPGIGLPAVVIFFEVIHVRA